MASGPRIALKMILELDGEIDFGRRFQMEDREDVRNLRDTAMTENELSKRSAWVKDELVLNDALLSGICRRVRWSHQLRSKPCSEPYLPNVSFLRPPDNPAHIQYIAAAVTLA
eukprot:GHVU01016592.1.p1 GENE.GHVU01016592.1~~GHVU01016592.1.p1  ORF type:complete len:113 (-),score=4.94 GHVU01016592.1:164-502(-)